MLERQGTQVMLDEYVHESARSRIAGPLEAPPGARHESGYRTDKVDELYKKVKAFGAKIFLPIEDKWYRADDIDLGSRQFIVLDPDGYLLRFSGSLGTRPTQAVL
jgi:hypothetical protein